MGIMVMSLSEAVVYGMLHGLTAEQTEKVIGPYRYIFNLIFIVVVILVFWTVSRRVIKRIECMNANVERIANGEMTDLLVDTRRDELGSLSQNINEMAEAIRQSIEKEQAMICNVAHDLRTPVTSISGYVELLEREENLSVDGQKYVEILERKSKELSDQISELLTYSVIQFREKEYEFTKVSVSRLLEQVLIDFIPQLDRFGMEFKLTGNQEKYECMCNSALMVRLFENMIANSIRYGREGKKIRIHLEKKDGKLAIRFQNYGRPLSCDAIEQMFQPFQRGQDAKEYSTEGKGLGLAIAKSIVEIHHGEITVSNTAENEIVFTILLPLLV